MDRATLPATLNGGYIEAYEFDLHRNRFTLRVNVLDNGGMSTYDVECEKVSHVAVDSESRGEKGRLELTELWIDEAPEASSSEEWPLRSVCGT